MVAPLGLDVWVIGTVIIVPVSVSNAPEKFQQNPTTGSLVSAFGLFSNTDLVVSEATFS